MFSGEKGGFAPIPVPGAGVSSLGVSFYAMMTYFISVWEDPAWGQAHPGGPGGHAGTSMPGEASGSGGDWAQAPALSQGLLPTPGEAGLGGG